MKLSVFASLASLQCAAGLRILDTPFFDFDSVSIAGIDVDHLYESYWYDESQDAYVVNDHLTSSVAQDAEAEAEMEDEGMPVSRANAAPLKVWEKFGFMNEDGKNYVGEKKGCYEDQGNRDLPHKYLVASKYMTVEVCASHCHSFGYKYFGVQAERECFCGDKMGKYGKKPDKDCNSKCRGNKKQICGGGWRNTIYKVKGWKPDTPAKGKYMGCYRDNGNRDLKHKYMRTIDMDVEFCGRHCRREKYKYFGVQNGNECWCDNNYGKYKKKKDKRCRKRCVGNKGQKCGAGWHNSVYKVQPYKEE